MSIAATATVWLHGARLDEVAVAPGEVLELGPMGRVVLPTPGPAPWLLRAEWTGPEELLVTDAGQSRHRVGPDGVLELEAGPVRVEVRVVRRFLLRRVGAAPWSGSLPWLATVLAISLLVAQGGVVWAHRCDWFGIQCPVENASGGIDAEVLARLLRKDYDGEDKGVAGFTERPKDGTLLKEQAFLPAGDPNGPKDTPGGAQETAPVPQRTVPPKGEVAEPAQQQVDLAEPTADEAELKAPEPDPHQGPSKSSDGVDPEADDAKVQPDDALAEERQGWGLPDWTDTTEEQREIDFMLRLAKHRLRVDPNDPGALSILSYYQYLADDLTAAEATYDKLLEQDPEDAAAYNNKALVYKRRGEWAKEEGLYRVALSLQPDDTTALNNLAVNLAHQGRFDEALSIMKRLEVELPDDPYSDLHRCKIHAAMGKDDEALKYLEKSLDGMAKLDTLHSIEFRQDIRVDPSLERLRADPRFRSILRRYYGGSTPVPE